MGKQDEAWRKVFENLPVLESIERQGHVYLTADELKLHGGREPRLMAKLDTLAERPALFAEHGLALFPVRNGRYVLFRDRQGLSYYRFGGEWDEAVPEVYFSSVDLSRYDTYPRNRDFSESQALDFAFLASLLRSFCGDDSMQLTLRGRLFSGSFEFRLPGNGHNVRVSGVQIEVDAGYEGRDAIYLVEAKRGRREDFHIRQLYYPYLNWKSRSLKRIVPLFFAYSNGQYYLAEFSFTGRFGEAAIVRRGCFTVNDSPLLSLDLPGLLRETIAEDEPAVAYPQANDMDKVVDVVQAVASGQGGKQDLAEAFEFDERQADYYANAAVYLGLLARGDGAFRLTVTGRSFHALALGAERTLFLVRRLLARPSLREALELLHRRDMDLNRIGAEELAAIVARHTGLKGSTPARRASTLRAWLAWVLRNSRLPGRRETQITLF